VCTEGVSLGGGLLRRVALGRGFAHALDHLRYIPRTFPFSSIGAGVSDFLGLEVLPDFRAAFAMPQVIAPLIFPIKGS